MENGRGMLINTSNKQTNKPKTAATRVKDVGKKVATDPPQVLEEAQCLAINLQPSRLIAPRRVRHMGASATC